MGYNEKILTSEFYVSVAGDNYSKSYVIEINKMNIALVFVAPYALPFNNADKIIQIYNGG